MKKTYSAPVMYSEAYVAEQYVAASDCGVSVGVPAHGHVQVKGSDEIHCAFTASNCGMNASACTCGQVTAHQHLTEGTNLKANKPTSGHNCHILSTKEEATYFAENYRDTNCGNGVAALMGLDGFEDIVNAFS